MVVDLLEERAFREMEQVGESELLLEQLALAAWICGEVLMLTSPARYFCLLRMTLYASSLLSSVLSASSRAASLVTSFFILFERCQHPPCYQKRDTYGLNIFSASAIVAKWSKLATSVLRACS